jgi:hypothetical protein
MACDSVQQVRHGWLDALYEETYFMKREGIWQKGSHPQYAHAVDVLASQDQMVAQHELFHINGNALYDFQSHTFGKYLDGSAGIVPGSFDFSLYKYRHQLASAPFQQISQHSLSRFQYTELIMNNPTDLCLPTLGMFLERHPDVVVVHGKALRSIRLGSSCCNLFHEDPRTIQNAHSDQYHCLLSNISHIMRTMMKSPEGFRHFTLHEIDQIALGLSPSKPKLSYDPQLVCFKQADCCLSGPLTDVHESNMFDDDAHEWVPAWRGRQLR